MLKWLCENCMTYRPSNQPECRCGYDGDSMFGDNWDAEEQHAQKLPRQLPTPQPNLAWTPIPLDAYTG